MASKTPPVLGLHHAAYRCRDAEETRHFYEDILGLPLVHVVTADHVSTGFEVARRRLEIVLAACARRAASSASSALPAGVRV